MKEYKTIIPTMCKKKKKEKNEFKSVEVNMVTYLIKDKVDSFSEADIYFNDDDDSEKDSIIEFRKNAC